MSACTPIQTGAHNIRQEENSLDLAADQLADASAAHAAAAAGVELNAGGVGAVQQVVVGPNLAGLLLALLDEGDLLWVRWGRERVRLASAREITPQKARGRRQRRRQRLLCQDSPGAPAPANRCSGCGLAGWGGVPGAAAKGPRGVGVPCTTARHTLPQLAAAPCACPPCRPAQPPPAGTPPAAWGQCRRPCGCQRRWRSAWLLGLTGVEVGRRQQRWRQWLVAVEMLPM